jgi:NAD(P)-dependent dehydrogenase (short-subunit alcohol dehydrogenase family)
MATDSFFDISGRVILITGAASGLGLSMSEVFAERGAKLALLDNDATPLEETHQRLRSAGASVMTLNADVRHPSQLHAAIDAAAEHFGRLDVVFANAGIAAGPGFASVIGERNDAGAIDALPQDLWDAVIGVNLSGVFSTIQRAAFHMKRRQHGKIVVTTSIASVRNENWVGTPYMPAKAGAAHLMRQAALELAPYHITVNAIAPGFFPTNLGRGRPQPKGAAAAMLRKIPLGRVGCARDIQGLALFLASAASDFLTGAQIPIDGGAALGVAC